MLIVLSEYKIVSIKAEHFRFFNKFLSNFFPLILCNRKTSIDNLNATVITQFIFRKLLYLESPQEISKQYDHGGTYLWDFEEYFSSI